MRFPKLFLMFFLPALALQAQSVRDIRPLEAPPEPAPPPAVAVKSGAREAMLPTSGGVLAHVAVGGP